MPCFEIVLLRSTLRGRLLHLHARDREFRVRCDGVPLVRHAGKGILRANPVREEVLHHGQPAKQLVVLPGAPCRCAERFFLSFIPLLLKYMR